MWEGILSSILGSTVGSFVQVGISKLFDIELSQSENVDQKLKRMENTLSTVRYSIHSTEATQIAHQEWQNLLQDLEDVGYDVEDLTDLKKADLEWKLTKSGIDDVQDRLNDILKSIDRLPGPTVHRPLTTYMMDDRLPLGRKSDTDKVIAMLDAPEQPSSNLTVITIHGIIGVGKTTLAQLAYNHDGYMEPFHFKIWLSVPTKYDVVQLTRSILEEVIGQSESGAVICNGALGTLQGQLHKCLQKKKLLLVLDDVHNFDREQWDLLLTPLKGISIVSKIIVTTGNPVLSKQLVSAYGSGHYDLKCLEDKLVCDELLRRTALRNIIAHSDQDLLESLAKEISKKCKGLPLAIKIVGDLLRTNVDVDVWRRIRDRKISDNHEIKEQIVSAIRWGYCGVPLGLMLVVAYCSMFPSCYKFEKDKIIKIWMGEGLIPAQVALEDIGSNYMDQLLEFSFFQINSNVSEYMTIQNSIHEMAQLVFGKRFLELQRTDDSSKSTRILVTANNIELISSAPPKTCTGIRTLLLPGAYKNPVADAHLHLWDFEKLRVLDLSGTQITELTERIGNWKHLRFLDLSNTLLKLLPGKIVNLCVLQTLRLVNCSELLRLPENIDKLESLRHLELGGNTHLQSMPSGIGNLRSLQTINEFIVSPTEGQLKDLGNMNSVRGSLCIKKLENALDSPDYLDAKLADKVHLEKLELQWTYIVEPDRSSRVLHHLMKGANRSLEELLLRNYCGFTFPACIGDPRCANLTTIKFYQCPNCVSLPCLGMLPDLRSLYISEMPMIEEVDESFLGNNAGQRFQSLTTLEFSDMPKLSDWVGVGKNDMSKLKTLIITGCSSLKTIPSFHHHQHLQVLDVAKNLQIDGYFTKEQLGLLLNQ